jgi:hypothetical protein
MQLYIEYGMIKIVYVWIIRQGKGAGVLLKKIETHETMTAWDAALKYRTQYFAMIITEVIDQGQNDVGYVIYTTDDESEIYKISMNEYKDKRVAFKTGYAAEPYPQIGNVVYHAKI